MPSVGATRQQRRYAKRHGLVSLRSGGVAGRGEAAWRAVKAFFSRAYVQSFRRLQPRSPRPRRTTVRSRARSPGRSTDDDEPADLVVIPLSAFRAEVERVLGGHGLAALGARVAVRKGGRVELAFAGDNGAGAITAIKYRPLDGTSHDSYAENPSTWVRPIIAGRPDALDWLVCEGETDAARLAGLVDDTAAILVLPSGARAFRPAWAEVIPRGARVALCHDADEEGDAGAARAARLIGGTTVRLRPPANDWCDWAGDREAFLSLLRDAAAEARAAFQWTALTDVVAKPIVYVEKPYLQAAAFHLFAGIKNAGKGTWLAFQAARNTRGEFGERRHVLWIALGEDSYSIDVKPGYSPQVVIPRTSPCWRTQPSYFLTTPTS